ncbi:MAG: carboxypeptidase regulatory-like domain-containing protein, partial [Candidatus Andersenbacteria bacterium]
MRRHLQGSEHTAQASRGFTMIEILITTFIIGTVVTGLFGLFVLSMRISHETEKRIVAVALANERMEMVRNLPYVNVGTAGGVPAGPIEQEEQIERNGLTYTVTTDIRFVDDYYDAQAPGTTQDEAKVTICHQPGTSSERTLVVGAPSLDAHLAHGDTQGACGEGGQGTEPEDEFNTDYKQVRVEVSWSSRVGATPVLLITYVVPQGIEGGNQGGTLDFLALDSNGQGIAGATVHLINDNVNPPISYTGNTLTNIEGRFIVPGLPESSDSYEISVTKDGYTTEQTYDASGTFVPDPDHSHLSMVLREVTSKTFVIDLLSQMSIKTVDEEGVALPGIAYTLRGTKTIGQEDGEPVYVLNEEDGVTDSSGEVLYPDIVWDAYAFNINTVESPYNIKETSVVSPFAIEPGETLHIDAILVPWNPHTLHVTVVSPDGEPINDATVQLTNGSEYDPILVTGVLGQVFFDE